ncbi:excinuclease ABC subunit UvrC [Acetobacter lambici]|uniref:UvrABC system protein C n=1 Tax=Acetobacter lambici TaxID=1332824 RepID=A0ABT1EW03_9PROT|nr:excinuclease ABC subunit UvrC [Acetobacter lambici]MCP1241187.1 excinuclease ABC subunit UvrC [Acetobacter lambici]MCP1257141.1 excinuclease ABC subunit UvrC [Acetobacter lambici]NHO55634.1 excinuclease ABC subunit UvrC [Acetobacter lambici]
MTAQNSSQDNTAAQATPLPQPPAKGVEVIRLALRTMPFSPGVYRMLGSKGEVLYVGKALSLKKRVTSYTQVARLPERLRRMVSETATMEIVTTHTEAEALLLEANYIKRMKPRFNILLRDDKSYPWLMLTDGQAFPQIAKHRGKAVKGASLWGPFASAWAVNQTLNLIQRVFLLRSCADSVFNSRSRPCLLFQIKRCSAPCVERIDQQAYGQLVEQARDFLSGKDSALRDTLGADMNRAAEEMDFERAAVLRDRIRALAQMQDSNVINPASLQDADVFGLWQEAGQTCIQVFFVRGGRNNGSRSFFPAHAQDEAAADILSAFITQFYDDKPCPAQILVNHTLAESPLMIEAFTLRRGKKVEILNPQRGEKKQVVDHAVTNARDALNRRLAETAGQAKLLKGVAEVFGLDAPPERIEVYDNSHIQGAHAYGVMIVGGPEGFNRKAYRKFRIKGPITPGDDFAMMREVLERRFGRALREADEGDTSNWPDVLLIDGGAGQYSAVRAVLDELGVSGVKLVGIAKGPDRDAGREWFYTDHKEPFQLALRDPVLYYLQRLRDEAHRFAITTHRSGRSKALVTSELDDIPGIGPARKKMLLNTFGSARAVKQAGLEALEAAQGVSRELARAVYGHFHPGWSPD